MRKIVVQETCLITGGTGFLGSNIIRNMIKHKSKVIILKRSSSKLDRIKDIKNILTLYDIDRVNIEGIFEQHSISRIIHCATNYGRNETNPLEILEANLILPLRLLEVGKKHGVRSFINTDTILDKRINFYTLSKSQFKQWLEVYASELICINIELEHFYGPFDDDSKFITGVIHKLLNNVEAIDLTEGRQKRSFIYIDDVVEAFAKIIERSGSFSKGFYNFQVGSDESMEIRKFVEMAKRAAGNKKTLLNFGALPYRDNEIMEPSLDVSGLKELGWKPAVSLEEGLRRMIEIEGERGKRQR